MSKDDFFEKLGDFIDKSAKSIKDRLTLDITDLIRAVDKSDPEEVTRCLRAGVDPNARDAFNRLPLPIAVDNNIAEIVSLLLEAKANPNHKDEKGETSLYKAVYWENEAIIEMLLEAGADIHKKSGNGITPFEEAKNNTNNDLELLLQKYQDENKARQREADRAKHEALKERAAKAKAKREEAERKAKEEAEKKAASAAKKMVEKLEDIYGADGNDYVRPLLKAIQSKDSFAVKQFAEKVEDINAFDAVYNTTPLMMAIQMQNDKLAKFFIENGADPINFIEVLKHSPLTKAVSLNRYELVQYIIEKYPENIAGVLNFPDQALTPQFIAYKDPRMMDILIGAGADPHFGGKDIPSPLVKAIQKATIAILPVFARHKVNLNQRTDGKTPLEWAIFYNRMDWVNGLMAEGADPNLKNSAGQNALEYAQSLKDRETIAAVLEDELK